MLDNLRILFYDEDTWKHFINMSEIEDLHFGDLLVARWTFDYIVAIHSNGEMDHLPLLYDAVFFS